MRRIAVLTSGGDAPGMNAAIRSVVRVGLAAGVEVMAVRSGYEGLMHGEIERFDSRSVGGIMQHGGTVLGSSRAPAFKTEDGRAKALAQLRAFEIDGIVVIGGNGTQAGANALSQLGFPVVGVASTIDNDVYGFDISIGVDTALNVALEAIDRLKTTATASERAFIVEVMGRDHGYLALMSGIAGGAEAISLPEVDVEPEAIAQSIRDAYEAGKPHAIIVVAEGAKYDGDALVARFKDDASLGYELRLTKLGHVQRGGIPGVADRLLGLRTGYDAAKRLIAGESGIVVGMEHGALKTMPLDLVGSTPKVIATDLLEAARVLAM